MEVALSEKCFSDFIKLIHQLTGITIATNRTSMVEGRLRKRVRALNLASYEDYLKLVQASSEEQVLFIDLVTTNETHFFRTPRIWEFIEHKLLPNWFSDNPNQIFTAWSAASSSGEEAHSLGILCQNFKEKHPSFLYQIVGTDISNEMVELSRKGEYSGRSIEVFKQNKPDIFDRFMRQSRDGVYQISPEIKSRTKFQQHNLLKPYPAKDCFDLVLIRNVLIYFKGKDQEKVLSLIVPRLAKSGLLIIGESESLSHINTPFKHIEPLVYHLEASQTPLAKVS